MGLKSDIQKLKKLYKPKSILRFIYDESEITEEPNVIWVIFSTGEPNG